MVGKSCQPLHACKSVRSLPLAVRFSGVLCCTPPTTCVPMQGVRKHIPTDWRKRLQAIQAAASAEMKSLPADFDQPASMSYFNATEIRDRLAGSAEKGLFGGLKGSAGTWDKIVKAYEKQSKQVFIPTIPSWLVYHKSCMIYAPGRHVALSADTCSVLLQDMWPYMLFGCCRQGLFCNQHGYCL